MLLNKQIVRWFDTSVLSPPFGIGHTYDSFKMSGTIPKLRTDWIMNREEMRAHEEEL